MRKYLLLLLLTGCASSRYTGNAETMRSDLYDCAHENLAIYYNQRGASMGLLGAAFGPVGGITSDIIAENDDSKIKRKDLQPMIDKCMIKKGYNIKKSS